MNVRRFHGGAVDSVVLDGNDCSFSTINSERHVESIAVPVVENAEKPIRGTTAVMRRPRFQSMHEHALHDIVIVKDEPHPACRRLRCGHHTLTTADTTAMTADAQVAQSPIPTEENMRTILRRIQ